MPGGGFAHGPLHGVDDDKTLGAGVADLDVAGAAGREAEFEAAGKQVLAAVPGVRFVNFGHLGDGNLHVNVMHHASDPDQARRARAAKSAVLELTLSLGGTISGEHGVGLTKLDWLPRMRGEKQVAVMRAVKSALDPHGIMNPGKGF